MKGMGSGGMAPKAPKESKMRDPWGFRESLNKKLKIGMSLPKPLSPKKRVAKPAMDSPFESTMTGKIKMPKAKGMGHMGSM